MSSTTIPAGTVTGFQKYNGQWVECVTVRPIEVPTRELHPEVPVGQIAATLNRLEREKRTLEDTVERMKKWLAPQSEPTMPGLLALLGRVAWPAYPREAQQVLWYGLRAVCAVEEQQLDVEGMLRVPTVEGQGLLMPVALLEKGEA